MRITACLMFVFLLVCGLAAAQAPAAAKGAAPATVLPSESTVDSFMQQTFGYEPDVSWKIASIKPAPVPGLAEVNVILASQQGQQTSRFYVTADGQHAVIGEIIPFGAKPFEATNKVLEQGISGPSRGPKGAPVTIVEFGDLQCPACKAAQPKIESLIASEPNARFVFESFPLPMHNWALKGAAYADCVAKASNEAFWKFIGTVYADQADITAENVDQKLTTIATDSGVKGPEIAACAATPKAKADVDASIALGKEVNVTGTPTLYINGRSIGNVGNVPDASLKALVDFAAKQAQ
ncbi:MAG: thioredoxin domain-containing protein [Candidatus Sulfotelmatobacter sp.]